VEEKKQSKDCKESQSDRHQIDVFIIKDLLLLPKILIFWVIVSPQIIHGDLTRLETNVTYSTNQKKSRLVRSSKINKKIVLKKIAISQLFKCNNNNKIKIKFNFSFVQPNHNHISMNSLLIFHYALCAATATTQQLVLVWSLWDLLLE